MPFVLASICRWRAVLPLMWSVVAAVFLLVAYAGAAHAATLTVTTEADEDGAAGNTVACSLREAINVLNAAGTGAGTNIGSGETGCVNSAGAGFGTSDRIDFAIDVGDMVNAPVARISPDPRLPNLNVPMVIDGYSQDGAQENTNAANAANPNNRGLNTVIRIEIDGSDQGNGPVFRLRGGDTTLTGLAIFGGPADAIRIDSLGDNQIVGNFIGTDAAGGGTGNGSDGVVIDTEDNTVGGTSPASRNLLSNNGQQGVRVRGDDNTIQGNLIGTTLNGKNALKNGRQGILVSIGFGTIIGGDDEPAARNVISGNQLDGILVKDCACSTGDTIISENYIGTDVTGNAALPNGQSGIQVSFAPENTIIGPNNVISGNAVDGIRLDTPGPITFVLGNLIGVGADGTTDVGNARNGVYLNGTFLVLIGSPDGVGGNTIAFNDGDGVAVCPCAIFNAIVGNSIHSNGGLAIDLDDDGVTANDDANTDDDSGANDLQNYPVITAAISKDGETRIAATLDTAADSEFVVQTFTNPSCDASNFGEAKTFLGNQFVETDGQGLASFVTDTFDGGAVGSRITATATDPSGNTSEVSRCFTAVAPDVVVAESDGDTATVEGGATDTFTVKLNGPPSSNVTVTMSSTPTGLAGFTPSSLTFTPQNWNTPQQVTVASVDDQIVNAPPYTITFGFSGADDLFSGAAPSTLAATHTDNEAAGLSVGPAEVQEPVNGTTALVFSVTLSPSSASTVTVDYATSAVTATSGAGCTTGVDFVAASGQLTFQPLDTLETVTVVVCVDRPDEIAETLSVTLSDANGAAIGTAVGTGTITDRDVTPCETFLLSATAVGVKTLPVISELGCKVGDVVVIDQGKPNEERGTIAAFGSIILEQPTTKAHAAGALVIRVQGNGSGEAPAQGNTDPSPKDSRESKEDKETEEERQQRERTNNSSLDDYRTEGNVVELCPEDASPACVYIVNRDGKVKVVLIDEAAKSAKSIRVGDYLEADGEKVHEQLFEATDVTIRKGARR